MLRLTFERKKRDWSQTDLANRVEQILGKTRLRHQAGVSALELEQIIPTEPELAALGSIFNVTPAFALFKHVVVIAKDVDEVSA